MALPLQLSHHVDAGEAGERRDSNDDHGAGVKAFGAVYGEVAGLVDRAEGGTLKASTHVHLTVGGSNDGGGVDRLHKRWDDLAGPAKDGSRQWDSNPHLPVNAGTLLTGLSPSPVFIPSCAMAGR